MASEIDVGCAHAGKRTRFFLMWELSKDNTVHVKRAGARYLGKSKDLPQSFQVRAVPGPVLRPGM